MKYQKPTSATVYVVCGFQGANSSMSGIPFITRICTYAERDTVAAILRDDHGAVTVDWFQKAAARPSLLTAWNLCPACFAPRSPVCACSS